jgi:hypothetical protein
MKKHYFYSDIIIALFSKPSKVFRLLMVGFIFIGINTTIKAQSSGIYESYAILNSNGGGNIYYDLQANTGNTDFNGLNLGTFNSSNTLILNGAQNKVYECNTDDISNGKLYYRIYKTTDVAPVFIESTIFWTSNDGLTGSGCGGSDQNQTWQSNGANVNVLSSLTSGIYYLEIYTTADFTYTAAGGGSGTHYASNGGNNYKAQFTLDNPPIAVCKSHTAQLDATGNVTINASDIDGGSTDDISIASFSASQTAFTCANLGNNNVTLTVTDSSGQTTTCIALVTIVDATLPVTPTLADVNVGQCNGTPTAPTTTDACAGTITGTTSTSFPITTQGTTVVTWTFNDGNGNSTTANQNVILDDTVAPITPTLADVNVGQCRH